MKFEIEINSDGFTAKKDGEVLAEGRSGGDLLRVFNEVVAATGAPAKVEFVV